MRVEYRVMTPESVEFSYELAGLASRGLAALIDYAVMVALYLILWVFASLIAVATLTMGAGLSFSLAIVASFVVSSGYFAFCEWRFQGQTVGKRVMNLRVVDDRGLNIDFYQALIRNLLRGVDALPSLHLLGGFFVVPFYGVGVVSAMLNDRQKRVGDFAAGTLVVKVRSRVAPSAVMPPTDKYNTLQEDGSLRARIRATLKIEERETLLQLCMRRSELELPARQRLFAEAATLLEQRLNVAREPFMSEDKFVQNIAAIALAETPGRRTLGLGRPPRPTVTEDAAGERQPEYERVP